jgi:hypothetical protein
MYKNISAQTIPTYTTTTVTTTTTTPTYPERETITDFRNFFYTGSIVDPNGMVIKESSSYTEQALENKKFRFYCGFLQQKPIVRIIADGRIRRLSLTILGGCEDSEILPFNASNLFITNLRNVPGITGLVDALVLAYCENIWEISINILEYPAKGIRFWRFNEHMTSPTDLHEITFDTFNGQIELLNKYKGICCCTDGISCGICGEKNSHCSCCKDLEVQERLYLSPAKGQFTIKDIIFTNCSPKFSDYLKLNKINCNTNHQPVTQVFTTATTTANTACSTSCQPMSQLIIENPSIPAPAREKQTLYKNFANFYYPESPITKDGLITHTKYSDFHGQIFKAVRDFKRAQPIIFIRGTNQRIIPFATYSKNIPSYPPSQNPSLNETQLLAAFGAMFGDQITTSFFSAYTQDIWGVTVKLLAHMATEGSTQDICIYCSNSCASLSEKNTNRIVFDDTLKHLKIQNKYCGLTFVNPENLRCVFCNTERCCCCKDILVEEDLHLDLERELFVVDKIKISNFTPEFYSYIGTFFPAPGARKPLPAKISIVNKFNGHPIFNSQKTLQILTQSFPPFISATGKILGTSPSLLEGKINVFKSFIESDPDLHIIESGQKREPIIAVIHRYQPTNYLDDNNLENFVESLRVIVRNNVIADNFVDACACTKSIFTVSLDLLADPSREIVFCRINNANNNTDKHTITFNLDKNLVEISNKYTGIVSINRNKSICNICGKSVPSSASCTCCERLVINEILRMPLIVIGNNHFTILRIDYTNYSPAFLRYIENRCVR